VKPASPLLVAGLALASCRCSSPQSADCTLVDEGFGPAGTVAVTVETVVSGLEVPWSIAFLPDGAMLVTVRPGRIVLVDGAIEANVADVPVAPNGEGGLLGIALAPDFATSRAFFIYFTAASGNRLERWQLAADSHSATLERALLEGMPSAEYHDGGRLRVGPDGMLYVGTGDARQPDLAQDMSTTAGKILRIAPDGSIPADNPVAGSAIYLLGIRNTQGFDWLTPSTMVVTDHGPSGELGRSDHDEVNVAHAGENLGWPTIYGCESGEGMVSPVLSFDTATPPGGAAFYTGTKIPEWKGSLLVGTLKSKHLHRVWFTAEGALAGHEVYFEGDPPTGYGRLRDVIMGPDGDLYVTTSNCDGRGECPADKDRILRITRK
jgi:aldose sugar dehydrogenase